MNIRDFISQIEAMIAKGKATPESDIIILTDEFCAEIESIEFSIFGTEELYINIDAETKNYWDIPPQLSQMLREVKE